MIADQLARSELSRVMALDPGTYTFQVRDDKGAPVGTVNEVKVEVGKRYVIVVMGDQTTALLGLAVLEAKPPTK